MTSRLEALAAEAMEEAAAQILDLPFAEDPGWRALGRDVAAVFARHDAVILRGLPALDGGRALMAAISLLGHRFRTYRGDKVVKLFAMSPWTRDLAHTLTDGWFHTDLNVSAGPPALTGIQCIVPDPGAPGYGVNRVVRLPDLLAALAGEGREDVIHFLHRVDVPMANERSPAIRTGRIVENGVMRYHPETIRAGCRRTGIDPPEDMLRAIQRAALAASAPIQLGEGDMLLLSNHRTLHYRGECSVIFRQFPMDFIARRIFVLHVQDEWTHD
jgi:hypothetical protein